MKNDVKAYLVAGFLGILLVFIMRLGCTEKTGCKEKPDGNIKPLEQHLAVCPNDWYDAYGDDIKTRLVYSTAMLWRNQISIARAMDKAHKTDPNRVNWLPGYPAIKELYEIGFRDDGVLVWREISE